ncbi:MAG: FIST C-terminal domain-containing protein [Clostridiales Family XIII bacterium]|nr:FIST C-terminal domain-containing protein [Clostridiales Family XIII bacterium]
MIRSIGLHTYELNDPIIAAEEIKAGLKNFPLMENSLGIIMCDPEYLESGVYEAVCEALPFPCVGSTTTTQAVNEEADILILTVYVMTADDVFFSVAMSDDVPKNNDALSPTRAAFEKAARELPSEPKLIIAFPPIIPENAGDAYVEAFSALCPGVPLFGTLAISDAIAFDNCSSLCEGAASQDRIAFALIAGNINPRFIVSSVDDSNKTQYGGEITKSFENIVQEINGVSTYEYFEGIGLAKNGKLDEGLQFVPILIDFKKRDDYDGIPVVRAIVYLDENGYAVCRGFMYQNSVFTIINPTMDDILRSSLRFTEKLAEVPDRQATLILSCIVRRMTFGAAPLTEALMIKEKLGDGPPFMFAYAGGEICPTSVRDGVATNRFHNFSIIACVL